MNAGPREQFGADREQRAVDAQICPVLALAERAHERRRLAGAQRHTQRVVGLESCGGLLGGQLLGHGAGSLPHGREMSTAQITNHAAIAAQRVFAQIYRPLPSSVGLIHACGEFA
jgi:hypothetical protein